MSSSAASSVIAPGDYAPSPNTCSQALVRANQLRIQALLRQLLQTNDNNQFDSEQYPGTDSNRKLNTLRVLRKTLRELNYQLSWLSQIDFLETIERFITSDFVNDDWRLVNDCTQLLIETIPKFSFDLDQQTIEQLFPIVIENLGHQRSEIRRSSLLLLNMYLNERPQHFQLVSRLFIEFGLKNSRNYQVQKGAILSLPLLMTEQVVHNENLLPLIRCLSDLLISDDAKSQKLFYSLYLALQRLQLTIGGDKFANYMARCSREARILYEQAASRNNSLASNQLLEPANDHQRRDTTTTGQLKQLEASRLENEEPETEPEVEVVLTPEVASNKQVTFENAEEGGDVDGAAATPVEEIRSIRSLSKSSQDLTTTDEDGDGDDDSELVVAHHHVSINTSNFDQSDVSSTCSSQANLVEPSHYMSESALRGKPLANLEQLHHFDHSNIGLTINDINVSNSPTVEFGPFGSNSINFSSSPLTGANSSTHELKFGIFPKHLIQVALNSSNYLNRLEALEEIMCIIRDSPINHLAILMTYFDSFLKQFLIKLMDQKSTTQAGKRNSTSTTTTTTAASAATTTSKSNDYKIELIAIDLIETIVIKTKLSTIQYIRPMVSLLIKTLNDSRLIFKENATRVLHKMMAFLPPQHVIDAIFEHKHSKSVLIREESINRITAAVLEYNKNEFNLTKLCYHVLPMLADHHALVRLAALECLAVLANALGQERIGSLLTAAGAVQTGCDYDGLLDAINARLWRKSLPRCDSNGSIRYVLKPFLKASSNPNQLGERQAADIRWILEAPSSHQHVVGGHLAEQAEEHHAHRPGAYSPPEPTVQAATQTRRASVVGPRLRADEEGGRDENLHSHRHHHAKHQHEQQQQQLQLQR